MNIEHCSAKHRCADGGIGECSSIAGHYGRHVCSRCVTPFTADEGAPQAAGPAPPPVAGAPGGRQLSGKATDYVCAHCGNNFAIVDNRCIYCDNLLCLACNSANCPKISLKCAHCGRGIPTIGSIECKYCGYKRCDVCVDEGCPKPTMVCPHCRRPIVRFESALCYCSMEVHPECAAKCPQKPPQSKAGTVQPPRRLKIPKPVDPAARAIMEYACPHCGRGFSPSEGRYICHCLEMAHLECLDKCPSRPKGYPCCHCGQEITYNQERWVCWCNDMAHKECTEKCPSRPVQAAQPAASSRPQAPRPGAVFPPQIAAPVNFLCAHCGTRYADDNNKCVYCDKLLCHECRDTRCPWWH